MVFVAVLLLLPAAYVAIAHRNDGASSALPSNLFSSMPANLAILLCIPILFLPISQDINIRGKSARSDGAAMAGFIGGALFYSLVVISCSYMGITLARQGVKLTDAESAFPTFFKHFFPTWGIIAVLAGMAAVWSTLDTYLVNTITSVAEDVIKHSRIGHSLKERTLILTSGLIVFTAAMLIAVHFFQVLTLILTALLIYISVIIPVASSCSAQPSYELPPLPLLSDFRAIQENRVASHIAARSLRSRGSGTRRAIPNLSAMRAMTFIFCPVLPV
jgi:Na+/proline symporter